MEAERLFRLAVDVVSKVMSDNQGRHGEQWRTKPIEYHLSHALEHIQRINGLGYPNSPTEEDHLAHAATRLLMALQLREAKKK